MRRIGYQNAVLTAIAGLMAIGLLDRQGAEPSITSPSAAMAQAQPGVEPGGFTNALEQRKLIIAELRQLNSKLDRLDARLSAGLNVKVTDMPALKIPPEARAKPAPAETGKPAADAAATDHK